MMIYVIREVNTNKMIANGNVGSVFEGEDGKIRSYELVDIHNKLFPSKLWKVTEEKE